MTFTPPQLPSNRPKMDLAEQERIIAEWVANGGKIKRTPEPTPKPRPPHKAKSPEKKLLAKAKAVIERIQSERGLSEKAYIEMFYHYNDKKAIMTTIRQIIKSQFGLTLTTVNKYDCNGKPKLMMGLR